MSKLLPIEELNASSYESFTQAIHLLFEPAPPLAHYLYQQRPFHSWDQLLQVAQQAVCGCSCHLIL